MCISVWEKTEDNSSRGVSAEVQAAAAAGVAARLGRAVGQPRSTRLTSSYVQGSVLFAQLNDSFHKLLAALLLQSAPWTEKGEISTLLLACHADMRVIAISVSTSL